MADNSNEQGTDTIRTIDRLAGGIKTQAFQPDLGGGNGNAEYLLTAGQKTMAQSVPVTFASDQTPMATAIQEAFTPVTGTLANTGDSFIVDIPLGCTGLTISTSSGGAPNLAFSLFTSTNPAASASADFTLAALTSITVTLANVNITSVPIPGGVRRIRFFCVGSNTVAVSVTVVATRGSSAVTLAPGQFVSLLNTTLQSITTIPTGGEFGLVVRAAQGIISTANSSATPLGASAVFTGTSELVTDYASAVVSVAADVASAVNGLQIQQSTNGTNWDFVDAFTLPAGAAKTFQVPIQAAYLRVVLTNAAGAQSYLRLQTTLHRAMKRGSSVRPQDARDNENDMDEHLNYGMVYDNGTGLWNRQRGTITYGMLVDVARNASDLTASGSLTAQNTNPAIGTAPANSAVQLAIGRGVNSVTVQMTTGTTTGVVTGQVSNDGATWYTLSGNVFYNRTNNAFTATIPAATAGLWEAAVGGYAFFRATTLAATTGSGAVLLNCSTAVLGVLITNTVPVTLASTTITSAAVAGANLAMDVSTQVRATSNAATTVRVTSTANNNAALLKASAGRITRITLTNIATSVRYIKFYNAVTNPPVPGTTAVFFTLVLPPNFGGIDLDPREFGIYFTTGIGFSIGVNNTDSDNTNFPAAGDIVGFIQYG